MSELSDAIQKASQKELKKYKRAHEAYRRALVRENIQDLMDAEAEMGLAQEALRKSHLDFLAEIQKDA